jgi:ABC-type lipoprotein export system ATPase subunit
MINVDQVNKRYQAGGHSLHALKDIKLHIPKGEFVAIMGPSGSGKSTLLQLLGGLDLSTEGHVQIDHVDLNSLSEHELTLFRRRKIGFVFQNYQLLPTLTVEENIAFPLYTDRATATEVKLKVRSLLEEIGLTDKAKMFPAQLSGGEQQRIAIARALAMNPRIILADEPTGNLDRKRGHEILQLLSTLHREERLTIVMVTHDMYAAGFADRILMIRDGAIVEDISRKEVGEDVLMANFMAQHNA